MMCSLLLALFLQRTLNLAEAPFILPLKCYSRNTWLSDNCPKSYLSSRDLGASEARSPAGFWFLLFHFFFSSFIAINTDCSICQFDFISTSHNTLS